MTEDNRTPDHLRSVYFVVGGVVLLLALPLLFLVILSLLAGSAMH